MQGYADNFILVIPMEDEFIHTPMRPFCDDPTCRCHRDETLLAAVLQDVQDGLLTPQEATRLIAGKML